MKINIEKIIYFLIGFLLSFIFFMYDKTISDEKMIKNEMEKKALVVKNEILKKEIKKYKLMSDYLINRIDTLMQEKEKINIEIEKIKEKNIKNKKGEYESVKNVDNYSINMLVDFFSKYQEE